MYPKISDFLKISVYVGKSQFIINLTSNGQSLNLYMLIILYLFSYAC